MNVRTACAQATRDNFNAMGASLTKPYLESMSSQLSDRDAGMIHQAKGAYYLPARVSNDLSRVGQYDRLSPEMKESAQDKVDKLKRFGPYCCGAFGQSRCKEAFKKSVDWMDPRLFTAACLDCTGIFDDGQTAPRVHTNVILAEWMSMPKLAAKVLGDQSYFKGANLLAVRLIDKWLQAKQGQLSNPGDLYQDTVSAFRDSGASESSAREMAWDYLALYSTRGASASVLYKFDLGRNVLPSIAMVASVVSYLDAVSLASGKVYSLPAQVHTSCDYTRPYHFWTTAYFAHQLAKEGFGSSDAFDAIHAVETTYERFSEVGAKKSVEEVLKGQDLHSAYNVETQKNILFADLGAAWALNAARGTSQDLYADPLFQKMSILWDSIMAADAAKPDLKRLLGLPQ